MKKLHCIFTLEGAEATLGVSQANLQKKIKKAKKMGIEIWKIVGGRKLFDLDRIVYPEDYVEDESQYTPYDFREDSKGQLSFKF